MGCMLSELGLTLVDSKTGWAELQQDFPSVRNLILLNKGVSLHHAETGSWVTQISVLYANTQIFRFRLRMDIINWLHASGWDHDTVVMSSSSRRLQINSILVAPLSRCTAPIRCRSAGSLRGAGSQARYPSALRLKTGLRISVLHISCVNFTLINISASCGRSVGMLKWWSQMRNLEVDLVHVVDKNRRDCDDLSRSSRRNSHQYHQRNHHFARRTEHGLPNHWCHQTCTSVNYTCTRYSMYILRYYRHAFRPTIFNYILYIACISLVLHFWCFRSISIRRLDFFLMFSLLSLLWRAQFCVLRGPVRLNYINEWIRTNAIVQKK